MNFDFLHEMYHAASDLKTIKLDHHWYRLFMLNETRKAKIVRYLDVKKIIPVTIVNGKKIKDPLHGYFQMSPVNLMVPLVFMDVFIGYLFRGVDSKHFTVRPFYPILAYTPIKFLEMLSEFRFNTPIVFVEGVADAEAVSQFYPYTIAVLGNKVKRIVQQLLPLYTKQAVVFFDNDLAGKSGAEQSQNQLQRRGVDVRIIGYSQKCKYKDQAEMFEKNAKYLQRMIQEFGI